MKIAVIGGGFTGLAAAYELTKKGHKVTLFEAGPVLGGLAYGFKQPNWDWSLEYAYHHWFTNDRVMLKLINELRLKDKLIIKRPITANLLPNNTGDSRSGTPIERPQPAATMDGKNTSQVRVRSMNFEKSSKGPGEDVGWENTAGRPRIVQLDSPINLLTFPGISIFDKFRTAALLAFFKITPFWKPLENLTAEQLLTSIGGKRAYQVLWEPLLIGKFDTYAGKVSAAWFWARIKKRTPRLMYMEGGFRTVIDALTVATKKNGGKIFTNTSTTSIKKGSRKKYRVYWGKQKQEFDAILLTVPTAIAFKLFPELLHTKTKILLSIPHLFAQTLILETDAPILDKVYWLSITDRTFPFLATVAHTNFMSSKHYGGHHLTYFGNFLPQGHKYLSMTKEQLLKKFMPFIKRLSPNSKFKTLNSFLFVGPFAQPVHELHYSQKIPPIQTPVPNVYLANMDLIVPWDRGTNYAIELGQQAADIIVR